MRRCFCRSKSTKHKPANMIKGITGYSSVLSKSSNKACFLPGLRPKDTRDLIASAKGAGEELMLLITVALIKYQKSRRLSKQGTVTSHVSSFTSGFVFFYFSLTRHPHTRGWRSGKILSCSVSPQLHEISKN